MLSPIFKQTTHGMVFLCLLMLGQTALAKQTAKATAELLAETGMLVPEHATQIGLRLTMAPGWHTYWKNPGDSGLPTRIQWHQLPEGIEVGPLQWPTPSTFLYGSQVNFGYDQEVILPITIRTTRNFSQDSVSLRGTAHWLSCRESCIPEKQDIGIELTISQSTLAPSSKEFKQAMAKLPTPWHKHLKIAYQRSAENQNTFRLEIGTVNDLSYPVKEILVLSDQESILKPAVAVPAISKNDRHHLTLAASPYLIEPPAHLSGLIILTLQDGSRRGYHFNQVPIQETAQ